MTGTISLIPNPERLEESCALAEEWDAGFEYNDFYDPALLDDAARLRERIARYRALGRAGRGDTLHGAFYDVTVHSRDGQIRAISERRVRQSMDAAQALGVRGVVFHTGLIPNYHDAFYSRPWLEDNLRFWTKLCAEYPGIEVWMENMFDREPERLAELAGAMRDVPQFGVCLDYAHASVFGGEPGVWVRALAPYIRHLHLNDNDGLADRHDAVGDGVTDWALFDRRIRAEGLRCSALIETRSLKKQRRSLHFLRERRIYPF